MQYIESDTLIFVALIALVGWLFWLRHRRQLQLGEVKRMRLTVLGNALEKFSSADQFTAFLRSSEGQAIIGDNEIGDHGSRKVTMRFVQAGIVMAFVGAGLFLSASRYHGAMSADAGDVLALLNFMGTTAFSMGVGLIVVAMVTALWERWAGTDKSPRT
jgi:hypothetical protein